MPKNTSSKRPSTVPPEAIWNNSEGEWELGKKEQGKYKGELTWWREDGSLVCQSNFDDEGNLHGAFKRYHPNGEVSQEGHYIHGKQDGLFVWHTSSEETSEYLPVYGVGDLVKRIELTWNKGQKVSDYRFFNATGKESNLKGMVTGEIPNFKEISKKYFGIASKNFGDATQRANDWLKDMFNSGMREYIVEEFESFFQDQLQKNPDSSAILPYAVRTITTTSPQQTKEVEKIVGPLPPSYKEFMITCGKVSFLGTYERYNVSAQDIVLETKQYNEIMGDTVFNKQYEEYYNSILKTNVDWRTWPAKTMAGIFAPEDVKKRNFLVIGVNDPGSCDDTKYIMALHLKDAGGEAPIFVSSLGSDPMYFVKIGYSMLDWFNYMVDKTIQEVTDRLIENTELTSSWLKGTDLGKL